MHDMQQESLEKKWSSYAGTGINATKGEDALVLRSSVGAEQFAIVELTGGCWTSSQMRVVEEVNTADEAVAKARFEEVARENGYKAEPVRGLGVLIELFSRTSI